MQEKERRNVGNSQQEGRTFPRSNLQCRAKIIIGTRHYAGYLDDISRAGAKLRTINPIAKIGVITLTLPDLPPMRCELRWHDDNHAGVQFAKPLSRAQFSNWMKGRVKAREINPALIAEECEVLKAA